MTIEASEIVLDPAVKAVLDARGAALNADFDAMPLDQVLRMARAVPGREPPPNTKDVTVSGQQGAPIRVRLYFPDPHPANLPVLLHLHGGGFIGGSVEADDLRCARIARDARCIVASLDYRLAPEHPFPTAIEDAFAAWTWVTTQAATFGGDLERCAISGSSAGGHIAIGVTLLARAQGARKPLLQLLTYPVVDPHMATRSYRDFRNGPFMPKAQMEWYWRQYGASGSHSDLCWAPLTASATGLPPAHIITAEYDVLRDEGEAYASHLRAAGIDVTSERHPHMIHGFVTIVPEHPSSIAALTSSAHALRNVFG